MPCPQPTVRPLQHCKVGADRIGKAQSNFKRTSEFRARPQSSNARCTRRRRDPDAKNAILAPPHKCPQSRSLGSRQLRDLRKTNRDGGGLNICAGVDPPAAYAARRRQQGSDPVPAPGPEHAVATTRQVGHPRRFPNCDGTAARGCSGDRCAPALHPLFRAANGFRVEHIERTQGGPPDREGRVTTARILQCLQPSDGLSPLRDRAPQQSQRLDRRKRVGSVRFLDRPPRLTVEAIATCGCSTMPHIPRRRSVVERDRHLTVPAWIG